MKKFNNAIKLSILTASLLMLPIASSGAPTIHKQIDGHMIYNSSTSKPGTIEMEIPGGKILMADNSDNLPSRGNNVNVTVDYDYEPGIVVPIFIQFINIETEKITSKVLLPVDLESTHNIPEGRYDIVACFTGYQVPYTGYIAVIHEDVEINENTEILMSVSDAVNTIKFRSELPNGESIRSNHYHYPNPDNYDEYEKIPSNVFAGNFNFLNLLYWNGSSVDMFTKSINSTDDLMGTADEAGDFHITPLKSGRFAFSHLRQAATLDTEAYLVGFYTDKCEEQTMTVTAEDLMRTSESFIPTPVESLAQAPANEVPYMMFGGSIYIDKITKNSADLGAAMHLEDNTLNFVYGLALNLSEASENTCFEIGIKPMFVELIDLNKMPPDWITIDCPQTIPYGSNKDYLLTTCGFRPEEIFSYADQFYSYTDEYKKCQFAGTSPIVQTVPCIWDFGGGEYFFGLDFAARGILGEIRKSDFYTLSLSATLNGLPTDMSEISDGTYVMTVTDNNILVEGREAPNTVVMTFEHGNNDDTPPTLTMMQFRDMMGYITNKFTSSEGVVMQFTAIDPQYDEEMYEYTFGEVADVRVEYAPAGTGYWEELEVISIEDLADNLKYGYYYVAPLDGVTRKSADGWYDLRFTVADAAGNTQEQTVRLAFYIEDNVGIENIESDSENDDAIYNLQGIRISTPVRGLNIVRSANGKARKLMF